METLRILLVLVNQKVVRLRRADLVEIDGMKFVFAAELLALRRLWITAVVEAVALPRHTRRLHPLDFVRKLVTRADFHDVERDPVRTTLRDAVSEILTVL